MCLTNEKRCDVLPEVRLLMSKIEGNNMNGFEKVHFKGTFRDYQQRVLDRADHYLKDGKIHIVAAPGSGKTVLGLELIRRLGAPCIIFSPTTAIRQQWGQRFRDLFLDDPRDMDGLFSYDLHHVKLLNSVTYQALFTAMEREKAEDEEEIDCSDVDLIATMKAFGIRTICLDEAHHLRNEWQKALEKFIASVDPQVRIISLTATPPYDSEGTQWSRYQQICGDIDEEIFVPELVGQNTLCPHQDYVYFNYPADAEIASFQNHRQQAALAMENLRQLDAFALVHQKMSQTQDYEALFSAAKEYIAVLTLLRHYGFTPDKKLVRELTLKKGLPDFQMEYGETALQFLLDGDLLDEGRKQQIAGILKQHEVYEKRKVTLSLNEKLRRTLISSTGKLQSIARIAESEASSMGTKLRMLVLTDYIKKESLSKIATETEFHSVNIVSIFETLRRAVPQMAVGVLSGSLVILPDGVDLSDIAHKKTLIPGTHYCTVTFPGSLHRAVEYVGKLFEQGKIQILVGTKSLLGEGWDSPCINSLILASFVGSFVLSNQMRGRAIRIDKNDPNKAANIWHLVTVEPEHLMKETLSERIQAYMAKDDDTLASCDYEILKRRFDAFMGPNYTTGAVESGIQRITAIRPPFHQAGIARINQDMLQRAADRQTLHRQWQGEVGDGSFAVCVESVIPEEKRVPTFVFRNHFMVTMLMTATNLILTIPLRYAWEMETFGAALLYLALMIPATCLLIYSLKRIIRQCSPVKSMQTLGKAVYLTLRECELIAPSARVETQAEKNLGHVAMYLRNASVHDQNVFNTAMTELLSPIENPRYLLIRKSGLFGYNYALSFACPSIIGRKKEYAQVLADKLKATSGKFEAVYTHREGGRKMILKCRKYAYITQNEKIVNRKYKVSHWK